MPHPRHQAKLALAALAGSVALLGAGCGFDSSSDATQNRECRGATIGDTTRTDIHAALGDPTMTEHETWAGRRVVADIWVDGTVAFSFDDQTEVLVEKDC